MGNPMPEYIPPLLARAPQCHIKPVQGSTGERCRRWQSVSGTQSYEAYPMKALVYVGPSQKALQDRPKPAIKDPTDAIVKMSKTTICGTDLHILKGDVPTCTPGRILGHEGVGVIDQVGPGVSTFHKGDRVLISCVTACGKCEYCRRQMYSHCTTGGWILGNSIDGTQAEYVRIPHADTSLYPIPEGADEEALVMLSDILPTGFECGVLNGRVQPGGVVAIVGAGPIGLAALLTAQFYSPAEMPELELDGKKVKASIRYYEVLEPQTAETLATFSNIPGHPPAVTVNRYGKGQAIYLAAPAQSSLIGPIVRSPMGRWEYKRAPKHRRESTRAWSTGAHSM
jgi:hypothetical protein